MMKLGKSDDERGEKREKGKGGERRASLSNFECLWSKVLVESMLKLWPLVTDSVRTVQYCARRWVDRTAARTIKRCAYRGRRTGICG